MSEPFVFNGIIGATGGYLLPEMSAEQLSKLAQGEEFNPEHLEDLSDRDRKRRSTNAVFRLSEDADPKDLAQAGWGIVFAFADKNQVDAWKEALKPLLDLRQAQAGDLYKEFTGPKAYRPSESKNDFLKRHGMGPGPAVPRKVPYYLLIVGSPESIPYRIQYELDVQYAVGRICFDTVEEYANYARSVVQAEQGKLPRSTKASFFGVQNPADQATKLSSTQLIQPLAEWLADKKKNWSVQTLLKEECGKAGLTDLLHQDNGPALLFTASHGMGFPKGDSRQLSHQGALLCQDWPGPLQWAGKPIPEEHYFSADDVSSNAKLGGMINFHFACYGAGTPQLDDFAHRNFSGNREEIAPHAFMARLPQRLLGHPKGGALAVIGHVERAWGCSFVWDKAGPQLAVFSSAIKRLTEGHPVGSAMEYFNEKYAELSTVLSNELEEIKYGATPKDLELAETWTANNDARSYVIIGDPAVRLPASATEFSQAIPSRPTLREPLNIRPKPQAPETEHGAVDSNTDYGAESGANTENVFTVTTSTAEDVVLSKNKKIAVQTKITASGMETVIAAGQAGNDELLALHRALVEKAVDSRSSGGGEK